jgi:RNA polymerase sigma factor (sigma-70 family)
MVEINESHLFLLDRIARQRFRGYADALSAGYLGLHDAARRFEPGRASFTTYATRRITGAIRDDIRAWHKRQRPVLVSYQDDDHHSPTPGPQQQTAERERKNQALSAVKTLPTSERRIIELYYFDDLDLKATGSVLGLSESRVCTLKNRALKRLREQLKGFSDG